jgi:glutamate--cysteine ligase
MTESAPLTLDAARRWCHDEVFAPGVDETTVGIEIEWLTRSSDRSRLPLHELEEIVASLGALPAGGKVTIEPGGQLEISTKAADGADAACAAAAVDLYVLDTRCAEAGIELVALGADPERVPERVVTEARYRVMQDYFDGHGKAGRTMMCNTAAVQINVSHAGSSELGDRWRLANALGPVMIASFANSPFADGKPTGWQSSRLRSWWLLDPSRSAPVPTDGDPAERWLDYALDAQVMLLRDEDDCRDVAEPMTFGEWLSGDRGASRPTLDDLEYHLTTLFPPVRPRGWLELRMFDSLPTPFWHVATAVTVALLDDAATDEAMDAVGATDDLWVDAAQLGLGHPELAGAARRCFELAIRRLRESDAESATLDLVEAYYERWAARGRSPADDRLDAWRRDGTLWPARESPVPYIEEILTDHVLP